MLCVSLAPLKRKDRKGFAKTAENKFLLAKRYVVDNESFLQASVSIINY
jgi:hypothetical protein